MTTGHERHNREFWDADADDYQAAHGAQLGRGKRWGVWALPEEDLGILGDLRGLDVLEYGCGGAQWSVALASDGARPVGLDQSVMQLRHACKNLAAAGIWFPLVCASGEAVPLDDGSFDVVFCDHGAMSFCDPDRSVPEVARLLRPGGRLVFNKATILHYLTWDEARDTAGRTLQHDYFASRVYASDGGTVDFQISYGEWIRLFGAHGLVVEDLVELRAPRDATSTYDMTTRAWARRWPAEEVWKLRKE